LTSGLASFVQLLGALRIPAVFTVERPLATKGGLPPDLEKSIPSGAPSLILEKDFFDLTAEPGIPARLSELKKKQMILAGCETDVCVLQSCLGLLQLGYEVYVIEDLLFSSSANVGTALERMRSAGATLLTFKTLFHELVRAVEGSAHRRGIEREFAPLAAELRRITFR